MDPFSILGVTASIIACIQLTGALLKRVGPSHHSTSQLNRILFVTSSFRGACEGLKLCLEFNEKDSARSMALRQLEAPLKESKAVLDLLQQRLRGVSLVGQHLVGVLWDAKLKSSLQRLEEAKALFELAMHADQW